MRTADVRDGSLQGIGNKTKAVGPDMKLRTQLLHRWMKNRNLRLQCNADEMPAAVGVQFQNTGSLIGIGGNYDTVIRRQMQKPQHMACRNRRQ